MLVTHVRDRLATVDRAITINGDVGDAEIDAQCTVHGDGIGLVNLAGC